MNNLELAFCILVGSGLISTAAIALIYSIIYMDKDNEL